MGTMTISKVKYKTPESQILAFYHGFKNQLTPIIIETGRAGNLLYEISEGVDQITGKIIYGLTVLEISDESPKTLDLQTRHDLTIGGVGVDELKIEVRKLRNTDANIPQMLRKSCLNGI